MALINEKHNFRSSDLEQKLKFVFNINVDRTSTKAPPISNVNPDVTDVPTLPTLESIIHP